MTSDNQDPIFDPDEFIGEKWEIKAGDIGHPEQPYFAVIRKQNDGTYTLYSKSGIDGGEIKRQELKYVERTRTLEGDGDGVHRSISFWERDRSGPNRPHNRIFAMRSTIPGAKLGPEDLCPWEDSKAEHGSWGGEDGWFNANRR